MQSNRRRGERKMTAAVRWRQLQCTVEVLACLVFLLPFGTSTASVASGVPGNYETMFDTPWEGSASKGPQHLDHISVAIPTHIPAKKLYYDMLGFAPDARRLYNLEKGSGTIWANIGTSQIHLREGDSQVVPGTIGLVYPDLAEVVSRLKEEKCDALNGTKFAWKERPDGALEVTCPYGNVFHLHQHVPMANGTDASLTRRISTFSSVLGLGIAYAHFRVRAGTAAGVARFYREVLGADVIEVGARDSSNEPACSLEYFDDGEGRTTTEALVRVGPVQHLGFMETKEPLPEYDGHHICLYMTDEGFKRSFLEAERRGLVFINPRPNAGNADTLEKALDEKQYRVKDVVDPSTGELLHTLEHEIRSVLHPDYLIGRTVSVD